MFTFVLEVAEGGVDDLDVARDVHHTSFDLEGPGNPDCFISRDIHIDFLFGQISKRLSFFKLDLKILLFLNTYLIIFLLLMDFISNY